MKKVLSGSSSVTLHYAGAYEVHDGIQVKHLFAGALPVATRVSSGDLQGSYFPHGDHLGSLNVLTNGSGTEVQRHTYLPFGEDSFTEPPGTLDFHWHRFTDQEQGPETGLYFYQARYYNPVLGRFLSPDSIVPDPGNSQSLNRYSYVLNNPQTLVDPSGDFTESPTYSGMPMTDPTFGIDLVTSPTVDWTSTSELAGLLSLIGIPPLGTDPGSTTGFADFSQGTQARTAASLLLQTGNGTWLGLAGVQSPAILTQGAGIPQSAVRVAFGETSGLYPQLTDQTLSPWRGVYNPRNWDPESLQELQEARGDIIRVFENRQAAGRIGGIHPAGPPSPEDTVAYRAWELSAQAALMTSSLPPDVQHFFMRAEIGPQSPRFARGVEPYRTYGPFINVGGGPVPRSSQVYIDFYRGIP